MLFLLNSDGSLDSLQVQQRSRGSTFINDIIQPSVAKKQPQSLAEDLPSPKREEEKKMLFTSKDEVKIVKSCPVTKASTGVLEFSPELVAKVAGAVQDSIEWMVLLLGERSADGFHVKVTDFRVPKQRRSGADVKMAEPMEGDGSTVDDAVVGVLHSHHHMGAFFSGTDNTELNPFFKSSIVVAQAKTALGFAYKAEGKVVLPCGSVGKIDFFLKVTGSERWNAVEKHEVDGKNGFGDCDQLTVEVEDTETETITRKKAPEPCGLSSESKAERAFVFGDEGSKALLEEIEKQTVSRAPDEKVFGGGNNVNRNYGGYRYGAQEPLGKPSRRERRRLRREGKLSATREGVYSHGSSGAIDACEHGVLVTVDCVKCEVEGDATFKRDDDRGRYAHLDDGAGGLIPAHHQTAKASMIARNEKCEFDMNGDHLNKKLYMYLAKHGRWHIWLCAECYDWWVDGACDAFEEDIDKEKLDDCAHGVSLERHCKQCSDDKPPKLITEGANKWDKVAKDVLTADEYEKAKKEHVQSMLDSVDEKEARATDLSGILEKEQRAKALKVSERLGIVSGNVH